ncbi:MAG TPA: MarR family transcriptional regulator [Lachnospiraceae bacterium]|nr:MarR family transcriptional regulator [Lachnospiraceae bacterium]
MEPEGKCDCESMCFHGRPLLGRMIHDLDNMLCRAMLADGRAAGFDELTVTNGWIVMYLAHNSDREIFQRDIEREFSITRSTVSAVIKLMEQKGYLARVSVMRDARLKKLVLTERGRKFAENMHSRALEKNNHMLENITDEEIRTFLRVIDKIKQNVKE